MVLVPAFPERAIREMFYKNLSVNGSRANTNGSVLEQLKTKITSFSFIIGCDLPF
jgi:hypothetical protein